MKPVLSRSWLVAARSRDLRSGRPLARTVLEKPVVLFRGIDEIAVALIDRCPHRGAPLSLGRVREGCLSCPYHGWRFDSAGVCQEIPGLANQQLLDESMNAEAVAVRESHGLIWLNLGGAAQGEPHVSPALAEPDRFTHFIWKTRADGDLLDVLENFLDGTHTHYVHRGLIRGGGRPRQKVTARIRLENGRVEIRYTGEGKQSGLISRIFETDRAGSIGRFVLPSVAELEYHSSKGCELVITAYLTPETQRQNLVHAVVGLRRGLIPGWLKRVIITPFFKAAMRQDLRILTAQAENLAKFESRAFRGAELDMMRTRIRRLWHEANPEPETAEVTLFL